MHERIGRVKDVLLLHLGNRKELKRLSLKLIHDTRRVLNTAEKTIVDTDKSIDKLIKEGAEVKRDLEDLAHPENAYVMIDTPYDE